MESTNTTDNSYGRQELPPVMKCLDKRDKYWVKWNKLTDKGGNVLVVLKKDKKKHYVWKRGNVSSVQITDLDSKKHMTIKPKDVHQVIQLPHTGYVSKHPELKKYGFR